MWRLDKGITHLERKKFSSPFSDRIRHTQTLILNSKPTRLLMVMSKMYYFYYYYYYIEKGSLHECVRCCSELKTYYEKRKYNVYIRLK